MVECAHGMGEVSGSNPDGSISEKINKKRG